MIFIETPSPALSLPSCIEDTGYIHTRCPGPYVQSRRTEQRAPGRRSSHCFCKQSRLKTPGRMPPRNYQLESKRRSINNADGKRIVAWGRVRTSAIVTTVGGQAPQPTTGVPAGDSGSPGGAPHHRMGTRSRTHKAPLRLSTAKSRMANN